MIHKQGSQCDQHTQRVQVVGSSSSYTHTECAADFGKSPQQSACKLCQALSTAADAAGNLTTHNGLRLELALRPAAVFLLHSIWHEAGSK
jgi:hypothetical protein